jgi:hypothetical protein
MTSGGITWILDSQLEISHIPVDTGVTASKNCGLKQKIPQIRERLPETRFGGE